MTEREMLIKIKELEETLAIKESTIKGLQLELKKITDTAKVWHERYHLLKLYGPDKVDDDGPGYNTPCPSKLI